MSSNTLSRVISAFAMLLIVLICVYLGKNPTLILCLFVSMLCIDELLINFGKISRETFIYYFSQGMFLIIFLLINIFFKLHLSKLFFTLVSLFLNGFLIFYLFKIPLQENFMKNSSDKYLGLLSLLVAFPMLSFGIYFESENWRQIIGLLLIVTFSMDTGAWFFGKNFGSHKLWPEISPKKTIEGFVGGITTSAILGTSAWMFFFP